MKLNKNQIRSIVTVVVIFAVYNVLAFVLPFKHTGLFWIGYSFGLVSIIVSMMILALAFGKNGTAKSSFYGFPIARIGVLYSAVQVPPEFPRHGACGHSRNPPLAFCTRIYSYPWRGCTRHRSY